MDTASLTPRHSIQRREKEILDALGIDMNFATVVPRKPLDKFRNDALRSVPPVKERRNDNKSHLIASQPATHSFRLSGNSLGAHLYEPLHRCLCGRAAD